MIVRYGDLHDDEKHRGKILLFIRGRWDPDAELGRLEELLSLRAAIDQFLFLEAKRDRP
jgi:hypothetical protein